MQIAWFISNIFGATECRPVRVLASTLTGLI